MLGERGNDRTFDGVRWLEYVNKNGATVPPFGILRITGKTLQGNRQILTADQPNAYGAPTDLFFINGPAQVTTGAFGFCTNDFPFPVYYDNASSYTPAFGDMIGPVNGSWKATQYSGGFTVIGLPDTTNFIVEVTKQLMLTVRGQVSSDVTTGSSGTLTVYTGAFGSEASRTYTIASVQNNSSCTVKANKMATAKYVVDNKGWEFIMGFNS